MHIAGTVAVVLQGRLYRLIQWLIDVDRCQKLYCGCSHRMYSPSTGSAACMLRRTLSVTRSYTISKASPGGPPTLPGVSSGSSCRTGGEHEDPKLHCRHAEVSGPGSAPCKLLLLAPRAADKSHHTSPHLAPHAYAHLGFKEVQSCRQARPIARHPAALPIAHLPTHCRMAAARRRSYIGVSLALHRLE